MRRSIVLASICVSLSCDSGQPEPSPKPSPDPTEKPPVDEPPVDEPASASTEPPLGAWVVIDERFGIYASPSADAPRIPTPPGDEAARRLRVAKVISISGEFIELHTIAAEPEHVCVNALGVDPNVELRMFVPRDALQPVLARIKTVEFDDGTKLELAPGVPVLEPGDEGQVLVDDVILDVPLTDADVARWSAPALYRAADRDTINIPNKAVLHYGERSILSDSVRFATDYSLDEAGRMIFVNACGRFVLRSGATRTTKEGLYRMKAPDGAVQEIEPKLDPTSILGGVQANKATENTDCPEVVWTAPAETPLRWPDGGEAGKVVTAHALPTTAKETGDEVCFEVSGLAVCIETARLDARPITCSPMPAGFGAGHVPTGEREVVPGTQTVSEGLDADIVRRIVRAHINEARSCYDDGLTRNSALTGRIEIAFEIGETGKVSTSKVHSSTLEAADADVAECFRKAVKRWTFPKPMGGATVSVVYPFDLFPS